MKARILDHIRSNVVGYIALFVTLTTGTAYALDGKNTVFSDDIVNGQVRSADVADDTTGFGLTGSDVANGSLTGTDVANGSVTGSDVKESTLSQVPSALLGGLGRWTGGDNPCDPESTTLVTCVTVELTLPAEARVLVIGRVGARAEQGSGDAAGFCNLGTNWTGPLDGSAVGIFVDIERNQLPEVPLVAVTPLVGPGPVGFGMDCDESLGGDPIQTCSDHRGGSLCQLSVFAGRPNRSPSGDSPAKSGSDRLCFAGDGRTLSIMSTPP